MPGGNLTYEQDRYRLTKTIVEISGEQFLINGRLVYSEIETSRTEAHGLLMNARFIQGVFDDSLCPERFNRWGRGPYDPERQTDELIAALPQWYRYGLRAFTVGFQGGGPCYTIEAKTIGNNPFGADGARIDPAYGQRMDRLIRAADSLGMVVIVSLFYMAHVGKLRDDNAVRTAVETAAQFLVEQGYTNVILEIANEHDLLFDSHLASSARGMASLIETAKGIVGDRVPVGCSCSGGNVAQAICKASDIVLIHGNGCSRQAFSNLISTARSFSPGKPVVCNEDSQALGNLGVAFRRRTSWGYYNNTTKQEPPTDWRILPGEDTFFALRMAAGIGIKNPNVPFEQQFYLQGLEPEWEFEGKRWIKLASLFPERIDYVDFFLNGQLVDTIYDDPFSLFFNNNWYQRPWLVTPNDREWKAVINLSNGTTVEKVVEKQGDRWVHRTTPFELG